MKQDGGSRRKLSKRHDPEASVSFYIDQGYPPEAVLYYLRGLANGRLAEMPLPAALAAPIQLTECGTAGPLTDLVRLEDISADFIAALPGPQILSRVAAWATTRDPELATLLAMDQAGGQAAEPGVGGVGDHLVQPGEEVASAWRRTRAGSPEPPEAPTWPPRPPHSAPARYSAASAHSRAD
jgi:hypothetical protein